MCRVVNSGRGTNSGSKESIPAVLHFSSLFALLSFWDLIYNDEFNSGSSCLNRLNNFGINSLPKTIKLATKCDQ